MNRSGVARLLALLFLVASLLVPNGIVDRPTAHAAGSAPPPVISLVGSPLGSVTGNFFNNPKNSGAFDVTVGTQSLFTQNFQALNFNPPPGAGLQRLCPSGIGGITPDTRPFTAIVAQPGGVCTQQVAQSIDGTLKAGSGSLIGFEAEFTGFFQVSGAGDVPFNFFADDGWILGIGPAGPAPGSNIEHPSFGSGPQPTYVSGAKINPPGSTTFHNYSVVGAANIVEPPTANTTVVHFPVGGYYPFELDYTECCAGQDTLTLTTGNNQPLVPPGADSPLPGEMGSPSENSTGCTSNDPIYCATGALMQRVTDLAIPGRGVPLQFSRTYNSLIAGQDGPLGFGWTDNYNMSLTATGSPQITQVQVHEETGSSVPFTVVGTSYIPPTRVLATLAANGDGTLTFKRRDQTKFVFTAPTTSVPGKLLRIVDRNNYTSTLNYTSGRLSSVQEPGGRSLTFGYNAAGRIATVTDPANRQVAMGYNTAGQLTTVNDVAGGLTAYTYSFRNQLLSVADPNKGVTSTVYNAQGQATSQTDPLSRTTTLSYTANADGTQTTTITDPKNNVTKELYASNVLIGRIVGFGTPQAATSLYTYDPVTLGLSSVIDPNGHVSQATYDAQGNLLSATDALDRTSTSSYDALNDLTSHTDPLGVTTQMTYDGVGNLLSVSRPLVQTGQVATTSFTYSPTQAGDIVAVTDPNGHTTRLGYDTQGNLVRVADPMGAVQTFSYDTVGRPTGAVSPNGNVPGASRAAFTTTFGTNAFGDLTSVTDPLNHQTAYQYDGDRNLTQATDARNNVTTYTYDFDNEVTKVTRADTTFVTSGYDGDGNVTTQTDALNHPTTYVYDPLNRVSSRTDPKTRKDSYGYDPAGNLTSVVDPLNRTTTLGYDAANELTSIGYSDGVTHGVVYTYTPDGQRASMTDGTGASTYSYDSLNRLIRSVNGAGQAVGYGYDLGGNLTGLLYPGGQQVTRAYDGDNRLAGVTDWLGHTTAFNYDRNSNLVNQRLPFGFRDAGFNAANQLTEVDGLLSFAYGRDQLGQVSSATATPSLGVTAQDAAHTYSYDTLNRLTGDQQAGHTTAWGYNGNQALTGITDTVGGTATTSTLGYDTAWELTSLVAKQGATTTKNLTLGYNLDGDRTSQSDSVGGTSASFGYDQADRLTSYTSGATTASYAYDGDGLRAKKTVNSTTEPFTYDLAEGLPLILQDGATLYVTGLGGLPLEQVDAAGKVLTFHADQLGSTRALTDYAGNVVAQYTFDAYGNRVAKGGAASTPFGFAGQYTDAESGLQYLRARYYDPATAQFLSADPLAPLTREPYAYAGDNPLNATDPAGLCHCGGDNGGGGWQQWAGWGAIRSAAGAAVSVGTSVVSVGISVVSGVGATVVVGYGALKAIGGLISPTSAYAAGGNEGDAGTVNLYRAVSDAERTDIQNVGGFRGVPGAYEGKLFATSAEDAARFGRLLYRFDKLPFHIIQVTIPADFAKRLYYFEADRMAAVSISEEQLAELNTLGSITIHDCIPLAGG